jgi:hypothetical protein
VSSGVVNSATGVSGAIVNSATVVSSGIVSAVVVSDGTVSSGMVSSACLRMHLLAFCGASDVDAKASWEGSGSVGDRIIRVQDVFRKVGITAEKLP